jgi:transposase InsO family protein
VGDKELLAIIEACKQWRAYLSGAKHTVMVFTDHKNLANFTTTKPLNRRQVRWSEEIAGYDLQIHYRKGSENGRADALSRRTDHEQTTPDETRQVLVDNGEYLTPAGREAAATARRVTNPEWEEKLRAAQQAAKQETYKGKLFVPEALRSELMDRVHGAPTSGHQGVAKTYHRLRRNYDWPGARRDVQNHVSNCITCAKSKSSRHKPYGTIRQPAIPEGPWQSVTMDFIVKLPPSKDPVTGVEYDSILNINDRFTKGAEFIPYKEASNAEKLAHIIIQRLVSRYGLPEEFITDRGSVFTSNFWQSLTAALGVKSKLSTAYHAQTDGQTERTNQTLEQYLRSYINKHQDDWVAKLPLAQFAYNSSPSESTGFTPFFANHGWEPEVYKEPHKGKDTPKALKTADEIRAIHEELRTNLTKARERQAKNYNKTRIEGPTFQEGDMVFLVRKNIKTKRPSSKLDFKKLGPFRVEKVISDVNYKLELPDKSRIHPVFHVSLLEPAPPGAGPEIDQEIDEEPEYEVEKILQQRAGQQGLEYLIKWKGYPPSENSWEPAIHLANCQKLLRQFHQQQQEQREKGA